MALIESTFTNSPGLVPLKVQCLINNAVVWEYVLDSTPVTMKVNLDDHVASTHQVAITFAGKTGIENDDASSTVVQISNIQIESINIEPVLQRIAQYHHNTNGYSDPLVSEYSNCIGFDGSLQFELETPVSNWFYKNYPW